MKQQIKNQIKLRTGSKQTHDANTIQKSDKSWARTHKKTRTNKQQQDSNSKSNSSNQMCTRLKGDKKQTTTINTETTCSMNKKRRTFCFHSRRITKRHHMADSADQTLCLEIQSKKRNELPRSNCKCLTCCGQNLEVENP